MLVFDGPGTNLAMDFKGPLLYKDEKGSTYPIVTPAGFPMILTSKYEHQSFFKLKVAGKCDLMCPGATVVPTS